MFVSLAKKRGFGHDYTKRKSIGGKISPKNVAKNVALFKNG